MSGRVTSKLHREQEPESQPEQASSRKFGRQGTDCGTPPQDSSFFAHALGTNDRVSDDLSAGEFVPRHYRRKDLDDPTISITWIPVPCWFVKWVALDLPLPWPRGLKTRPEVDQ